MADPTGIGVGQDPALMDYLYEMSAMQPEQQDLQRRRLMVQQLRNNMGQMPEGTLGNPKRGFTPARSPLEYLGPLMAQGLAGYQERGIGTAQQALNQQRMTQLQALRDRFKGQQPGMQFPQQPMPGEDTQPY